MISKNQEFPRMLGKEILEYMRYAGEVRFHLIRGEYFLYTSRVIALRLGDLVKCVGEITVEELEKYHLEEIHQEMKEK